MACEHAGRFRAETPSSRHTICRLPGQSESTRTWMVIRGSRRKDHCWGRFYRKEFSHAVEQTAPVGAFLGSSSNVPVMMMWWSQAQRLWRKNGRCRDRCLRCKSVSESRLGRVLLGLDDCIHYRREMQCNACITP